MGVSFCWSLVRGNRNITLGCGGFPHLETKWVWLEITRGVTQVLVHVSTYQGSVLGNGFLSHSHMSYPGSVLFGLVWLEMDGFHWFRWVLSRLPGKPIYSSNRSYLTLDSIDQRYRTCSGGSCSFGSRFPDEQALTFHAWQSKAYTLRFLSV